MTGPIEIANIRPGESAAQFTDRAERALAEAKALSDEISGNLTELNRWMAIASPTKTWMQALYFSVECMKRRRNGVTPDLDRLLI
jgi:hypothetical protein